LKLSIPEKAEIMTEITWDGDTGGVAVTHGTRKRIEFDTPPMWGGKGRAPCPDELFLAALGGCINNTFLFLARDVRDILKSIKIALKSTLVFEEGVYKIKRIDIDVDVGTESEYSSVVETLLEKALEYCHLTRHVKRSDIDLRISYRIHPTPLSQVNPREHIL